MNKKVRNAVKTQKYDLSFDSRLELYFYEKCLENNISFSFKEYKFILIDSFKYNGKSFRQMTWTPDFYLKDYDIIIDTKGFETSDFKMKFKLFCSLQQKKGLDNEIVFLKNQKEVNEFINNLKNKEKKTNDVIVDLY